MVCFGIEPGAAGRKEQMNPLSYGSTPTVANHLNCIKLINWTLGNFPLSPLL